MEWESHLNSGTVPETHYLPSLSNQNRFPRALLFLFGLNIFPCSASHERFFSPVLRGRQLCTQNCMRACVWVRVFHFCWSAQLHHYLPLVKRLGTRWEFMFPLPHSCGEVCARSIHSGATSLQALIESMHVYKVSIAIITALSDLCIWTFQQ